MALPVHQFLAARPRMEGPVPRFPLGPSIGFAKPARCCPAPRCTLCGRCPGGGVVSSIYPSEPTPDDVGAPTAHPTGCVQIQPYSRFTPTTDRSWALVACTAPIPFYEPPRPTSTYTQKGPTSGRGLANTSLQATATRLSCAAPPYEFRNYHSKSSCIELIYKLFTKKIKDKKIKSHTLISM